VITLIWRPLCCMVCRKREKGQWLVSKIEKLSGRSMG
jgi:hypothetical protein